MRAMAGMTKKKLEYLVKKLFKVLKKRAKKESHIDNTWECTWVSMATAKKKRFKAFKPIPAAERFIDKIIADLAVDHHLRINHVTNGGASYKLLYGGKRNSFEIDWINVPHQKRFKEIKYYYKTFLHELSHCLMERLKIAQKIDLLEDEESVAEFSSMVMCILLGIDVWEESYKYLSDYMSNSVGFLIPDGRLDYIESFSLELLEHVLKLK
jgi:hypothetical protein